MQLSKKRRNYRDKSGFSRQAAPKLLGHWNLLICQMRFIQNAGIKLKVFRNVG